MGLYSQTLYNSVCWKVRMTSGNNRHAWRRYFEEVAPSALAGSKKIGWFAQVVRMPFPPTQHAQFKPTLTLS